MTSSNPDEFAIEAYKAWRKENPGAHRPTRVYISHEFWCRFNRQVRIYGGGTKEEKGEMFFGAPCFIIADERHPSIVIA